MISQLKLKQLKSIKYYSFIRCRTTVFLNDRSILGPNKIPLSFVNVLSLSYTYKNSLKLVFECSGFFYFNYL